MVISLNTVYVETFIFGYYVDSPGSNFSVGNRITGEDQKIS
jgi:hypothetical protein